MSHSYSQNVIHVVFSTKDRQKTIAPIFQPNLWAYVAGVGKKDGIFLYDIGGMEDHLHLLMRLPPTAALAKAINSIKSNSSRWANQEGQKLAWQQGYGAFSVSASLVPTVREYIQNQKVHHEKLSFEEEFLALLKKHRVEFDPRYVLG
jgi:REP element-mobilizing transposase RayT